MMIINKSIQVAVVRFQGCALNNNRPDKSWDNSISNCTMAAKNIEPCPSRSVFKKKKKYKEEKREKGSEGEEGGMVMIWMDITRFQSAGNAHHTPRYWSNAAAAASTMFPTMWVWCWLKMCLAGPIGPFGWPVRSGTIVSRNRVESDSPSSVSQMPTVRRRQMFPIPVLNCRRSSPIVATTPGPRNRMALLRGSHCLLSAVHRRKSFQHTFTSLLAIFLGARLLKMKSTCV